MKNAGGRPSTRSHRFSRLWMNMTCLAVGCSVGMLAACTGPPAKPDAETSGTASIQPAATPETPSDQANASVSFPGASGLEASVTNHPETPEMKAALPAQSSLGQIVDLDMKTGAFPSSGANLTFAMNDPLPADKVALVSNWDPGSETWIPLASETSSDGKSVSAKLSHFSTYGLTFWSNLTGKLLGVRTTPPDCPAPPAPPSWDDNSAPQYFDDINGPVLWCVGADSANPDDLEIKLKLNRGAAAAITTAINPVWTHSDLWQDDTPETWTQMVLAVGLQTGGPNPLADTADSYFIQPTGEYTFRFAKADVLNFWHSNRTKPLIQVDATIPYVVAGLLYAQASAIPALPLVFTLMALTQCSSAILSTGINLQLTASSQKDFGSELPDILKTFASCVVSQKEPITKSVADYWKDKKPTASLPWLDTTARLAGKSLMAAAAAYALAQVLAPVADALTDLLLDPIARQFVFQPSDQALKEYAQGQQDFSQTFHTGYLFEPPPKLSPRRASLSLQYPRGWTTSETRFGRTTDNFVAFLGPEGKEEVSFEFRSDAEGSCAPSNYETLEAIPLGSSGIASNGPGFHSSFVSRLYSGPYQLPAGSRPYSLPGDPSSGPPIVWNYGVDLVISGAEPANGGLHGQACSGGSLVDASNGVYIGVFSQHGFATEAEARAFIHSDEYRIIKSLFLSVRIKTWTE